MPKAQSLGGDSSASLDWARRIYPAKVIKRIEPGVVTVGPGQLQGIAANLVPAAELEALVGINHVRPNDIAKHIRLAATGRAGTGLAKKTQREECFRSVLPLDG